MSRYNITGSGKCPLSLDKLLIERLLLTFENILLYTVLLIQCLQIVGSTHISWKKWCNTDLKLYPG